MSSKKHEPTNNFVCGRCSALVCEDCMGIAEEWAELAQARARELFRNEDEMKKMREELARAKRKADDYERMMKLGQNAVLLAWIDDNGPTEATRKMEAAKAKRGLI